MVFNGFQNDTATLKRFSLDFGGNKAEMQVIKVSCDVQWEVRRITNSAGEEITTVAKVFISPSNALNNVNLTARWVLDYNGSEYGVERFSRVRFPASPAVSHYELLLK